jgi:Ice-binding-like
MVRVAARPRGRPTKKETQVKRLKISLLVLALLGIGAYAYSSPSPVTITLGTAANFGVLAGSGITNVSSGTLITGNVGSSPTPTVTGLLASQVIGTLYLNPDPATLQAQLDLTVAYNQAFNAPCGTVLTGTDLGGLTLIPGVYCFSSSAQLTGTLTLDGQGDPNAQWIFQMGSTLTTATNSTVSLINGAAKCNVYWQVGSSATIGTGSVFVGNILALTSITLDGGTLNGRALASNGAVTISSQETVDNSGCMLCTVFVSSSSAGTVAKLVFPMPFNPAGATQTVIATGLTSAEGAACGYDNLLYVVQSGVFGGPLQIMRMDQNGHQLKRILDFNNFPGLATSGGPEGPSFQPVTRELFFNTTLSSGFSNTGAWGMGAKPPVQAMLPFSPNGSSNGGGATAFLITGPYAGSLLAVDVANKKVIRVAPPFTSAQTGIDFITTNLVAPNGLAVNSVGNIFVSNTDGSIEQFGPDGTFLGQYATTGFHNMNIAFFPGTRNLMVATAEGPVIWIHSNGTQTTIGTVVGGDGVAICPHSK